MKKFIEEIGSHENLEKEYVKLFVIFDFYELPNCIELGISNINKSIENLSIIVDKAKTAYEQAFYIEFISLKIQYLEYFLRMYYVKKNKKGKIFPSDDKKTFGMIINDCKLIGFDPNLILSLNEFNHQRINAIHRFLLGDYDEIDFILICEKYKKFGEDIKNYVIKEIGIPIKDSKALPNKVGSMIFSVPK